MDYEYDVDDDYGGRVLWGRVAFFVVAAILVFFAGRCSAPDGISQDEYEQIAAQRDSLQERLDVAERQLDQMSASVQPTPSPGLDGTVVDGGGVAPTPDDGTGTGTGNGDGTGTGPVEGQSYTVQSGDTLITIAQKVYGDGGLWQLIADANNITQQNTLRVGQELRIPPRS
jgi:nucleoid-associated protein YgaU